MSTFFITHAEPLHPLRGQEAVFFIREQSAEGNRSHVLVKEIPHYFFTRTMELPEAVLFQEYLEQERLLEHMAFTLQEFSPSRYVLRGEGSKEDRFLLPEPFLCNGLGRNDPITLNSPARLLRWLYPPLMQLDAATEEAIPHPEDILEGRQRIEYVSLETVLADSLAIFDTEVKGWQTGDDHIYMAVYRCPAKNRQIIFHDFSFSQEEYKGHQLVRYTSQEEFGDVLTAQMHQDDPLWEAGHNIMNYDRIKVRDLTQHYFPATNRHYPITKSAQGLGRVLTKGRFTIDTYTYMFNYLNLFADNKLSTLAGFRKSLDYQEMDELERTARQHDHGAFHALLEYLIEDGEKTLLVAEQLKPRVALKSRLFHRDADSICSTGKATLGEEYWKRRHLLITKSYADSWKRWREEPDAFSIDNFARQHLHSGFTPGFFDDVSVVYLTPLVWGFLPLLNRNGYDLLHAFRKSSDALEKFDLLQTLQARITFLVREMNDIFTRNKHGFLPLQLCDTEERALYALFFRYGIPAPYENVLHSLHNSLLEANSFLRQQELVNRGRNLYFVHGQINAGELENKFMGCVLGRGTALSLREGKVIANPFQEIPANRFVYQGFDLSRGVRTEFEKTTLRTAVEKIFCGEKFTDIEAFLREEQQLFVNGDKPREAYLIRQRTRTHYRNLLGSLLDNRAGDGHSSITRKTARAYHRMKHRIHDHYSDETRRELQEIVRRCRRDFSFPAIQEMVEKIEHPFPSHVRLAFPAIGLQRSELMLEQLVYMLDLPRYAERIKEEFEDFYDILRPQQLELLPGKVNSKVVTVETFK